MSSGDQPIPKKRRFATASRSAQAQASADTAAEESVPMPTSLPDVVYEATQGERLRIVPDIRVGHDDYNRLSTKTRRSQYNEATDGFGWNGNNAGQKARGFYYSGEGIEKNQKILKIDVDDHGGADIEIRIHGRDQEDHFVKIHRLEEGERRDFNAKANAFADHWDKRAFPSSSRSCISGGMMKCGFARGSGHQNRRYLGGTRHDLYENKPKAGFKKGITNCQKHLNMLGKRIVEKHFPRAFSSIRTTNEFIKMSVPEEIGGKDGLCVNIIQSGSGCRLLQEEEEPEKNFCVECHVDAKDISEYCASVWTSSDSSDPSGWYFLLPFLTCKHNGVRYKGVAIRLRDGIGIEWAGRLLFHCSTAPNCKADVNGTFYGVPGCTIG